MTMVNVAVFAPLDDALTYSLPQELEKTAKAGHRVLVPLGRRKSVGIILSEEKEKPSHALKSIEALLDEKPIFSEKQLRFLQWASEYYLCPMGEILRTALPAPFGKVPKPAKNSPRKKKEAEIFLPQNTPLILSEKQLKIAEAIWAEREKSGFGVHLLHGITGSGKTEIYFRLMEKTLAEGKSILSLVPEISLTPQLHQRYRKRFGSEVALYHSGLNDTERMAAWQACRDGKAKIMLGTRSALFASFENLGLIIIDEEQDHSYKQEERVRYHARDLAILRAKFENVPILLGSATPSVESFYKAKSGKFSYYALQERFGSAQLPEIEVVDLRWDKEKTQAEEMLQPVKKEFVETPFSFLSPKLLEEIRRNIANKEQSLLLLNRRGFSHYVLCEDCGHTPLCPNCEITLTYHKKRSRLVCHYCDHEIKIPQTCPVCMGLNFKEKGSGTEKIEEEIQTHFPDAKIARMDRDTTQRKGAHHAILEKLANNEIDILVGTQMIAKGHDYPNVTLVGILSADSCLHLPDFRSAEETFQLITQMAGRAGRAQKAGRVLLQTFSPDHYSIDLASKHLTDEFYQQELELRKELNYPPFSRLTVLRIQGTQIHKVKKCAEDLFERLSKLREQKILQADLLGPSPCLLEKLRNNYRWQILLKSPLNHAIQPTLKKHILDHFQTWMGSGLRLVIDVDPVNVV